MPRAIRVSMVPGSMIPPERRMASSLAPGPRSGLRRRTSSCIRRHWRKTDLPRNRRYIDDRPGPARAHAWRNRLNATDCAEIVRLHAFLKIGQRRFLHGAEDRNPNVVHRTSTGAVECIREKSATLASEATSKASTWTGRPSAAAMRLSSGLPAGSRMVAMT
jgi:hypothetical protein